MEARGTYDIILALAAQAIATFQNESFEKYDGTVDDFASLVMDWFSSKDAPETILSDFNYQYVLKYHPWTLKNEIVKRLSAREKLCNKQKSNIY